MAPEYMTPPFIPTEKGEVFAIGVVIMMLLTGSHLFDHGLKYRECAASDLLALLDTSAGEWKGNSSLSLAEIAPECTNKEPTRRPTIGELLSKLKKVRSNAESQLSPEMAKTIRIHQSQSRISAKTAVSEAFECVQCGTKTTKGLVCPKKHFICSLGTCLEEMVRDQLGSSRFRCCGDKCQKRFELSDCYSLVTPKLYGEAIVAMNESINKNRAREDFEGSYDYIAHEIRSAKEDIVATLVHVIQTQNSSANDILRSLNDESKNLARNMDRWDGKMQRLVTTQQTNVTADTSQFYKEFEKPNNKMNSLALQNAAAVAALASGQLQCPRLCFVWPVQSHRSFGKRIKYKEEHSLYFLCAYDRSPVKTSIKIKEVRKWIKKSLPLVKWAIFALKVLATLYAVPIPYLPSFIPGEGNEKFNNILDSMMDNFDRADLEEMEAWLDSCEAGSDLKQSLISREKDIPAEAYAALATEAYKPENRGWMDEMEIANKNDAFAWLKKKNVAAWKTANRKTA